MGDFFTPPHHHNFRALPLAKNIPGRIIDCAIAHIEPGGGGPNPDHTHAHNHFFIVVEGCATIKIGEDSVSVNANESMIVPGPVLHSVWNKTDKPLKMIGISLQVDGM